MAYWPDTDILLVELVQDKFPNMMLYMLWTVVPYGRFYFNFSFGPSWTIEDTLGC